MDLIQNTGRHCVVKLLNTLLRNVLCGKKKKVVVYGLTVWDRPIQKSLLGLLNAKASSAFA